jgi:simple sugar transport system permease protein
MNNKLKRTVRKNEFYVFCTIIILFIVITILDESGKFFSLGNFIDILQSMIVPLTFCMGAMIVIISGGIDVSFPGIAAFASYTVLKYLSEGGYEGNILLPLLLAGLIGIVLGSFNAALISFFRLPTLIVTLGTQSIFFSVITTFIGEKQISQHMMPKGVVDFGTTYLLDVQSGGLAYKLPAAFLVAVAIVIAVWLILKYTMIGRAVYALGGDRVSAQRCGFNVRKVEFFIYMTAGFIAGIAGMLHASIVRISYPYDLFGQELTVIAMVVLGGTLISGGRGSVFGTILGVLIVTVINTSLILIGIPGNWMTLVTGLLILIGTGVTSYQELRSSRKIKAITGI